MARARSITVAQGVDLGLCWSLHASLAEVTAPGLKLPISSTDEKIVFSRCIDGIPFPSSNPAASRALSAFEFCLGAFIVIGHNVFHIVPNEVIVLSLLGLISIRLRDGSWSAMGFKRPASWRRILLIAVVAAILRILLGQFLIEPTAFFWPKPTAPAMANEITGNVNTALIAFLLVWTFAAFGEEIAYRGYLLTRAADVGTRSVAAYWIGVVLVSILFGYGIITKAHLA